MPVVSHQDTSYVRSEPYAHLTWVIDFFASLVSFSSSNVMECVCWRCWECLLLLSPSFPGCWYVWKERERVLRKLQDWIAAHFLVRKSFPILPFSLVILFLPNAFTSLGLARVLTYSYFSSRDLAAAITSAYLLPSNVFSQHQGIRVRECYLLFHLSPQVFEDYSELQRLNTRERNRKWLDERALPQLPSHNSFIR